MAFSWQSWIQDHTAAILERMPSRARNGATHAMLTALAAALSGNTPQPLIDSLPRDEQLTAAARHVLALRDAVQATLTAEAKSRTAAQLQRVALVANVCEHAVISQVEKAETAWRQERSRLKQFKLVDSTRRILTTDIDLLTHVHNHRHFRARFEEEVERAARYGETLSLLICDIDHFLAMQDRHGVDAAEEALRNVGAAMIALTRRVDCVARMDWDEFAVILPEIGIHGAYATAEKIRHGVERLLFPLGHPLHDWHITLSVGISNFHLDAASTESLLRHARACLGAAKLGGRNRSMASE